jgi:hypothetical protein
MKAPMMAAVALMGVVVVDAVSDGRREVTMME